jgi:hypothetical protein
MACPSFPVGALIGVQGPGEGWEELEVLSGERRGERRDDGNLYAIILGTIP